MRAGVIDTTQINLKNPSMIEPLEKLDEIGKTFSRIFKQK
jgi:hypothetical protein